MLTGEESLKAGGSVQHSTEHSIKCIVVLIHVNVLQYMREYLLMQLQIPVLNSL
jgi:hypothetical protein